MERLQDLEEQFAKVSGGLLLRLERPSDVGQRLLGDRAKDGSNAAFEMEMDRGRADPQCLGELAQAEPVCADALDQLGGGGDDRSLRETAFRFSLTYGPEVFFLGMVMMATMTLATRRIDVSAHIVDRLGRAEGTRPFELRRVARGDDRSCAERIRDLRRRERDRAADAEDEDRLARLEARFRRDHSPRREPGDAEGRRLDKIERVGLGHHASDRRAHEFGEGPVDLLAENSAPRA